MQLFEAGIDYSTADGVDPLTKHRSMEHGDGLRRLPASLTPKSFFLPWTMQTGLSGPKLLTQQAVLLPDWIVPLY